MLDGHGEDEGRLPVGHGPVRTSQRSSSGPRAAKARPDQLVGVPPGDLVQTDAVDGRPPGGVDDRDVDEALVEARESRGDETGDPVEGGDALTDLPDCSPQPLLQGEVPRVHGDRLRAVSPPSLRRDLVADVVLGDANGSQGSTGDDPSVLGSGRLGECPARS